MTHFVLDVEANGPCPDLYSMVSFGLVVRDDPSISFYGETAPLPGAASIPEALAVSGMTLTEHLNCPDPQVTMLEMKDWLEQFGTCRHVIWSDNPAFDWQWINYYSHKFLGYNPFGFSARRIGDFYAGVKGNVKDISSWKKMRGTKHTHNPVDDARGNAEALLKIIKMSKDK